MSKTPETAEKRGDKVKQHETYIYGYIGGDGVTLTKVRATLNDLRSKVHEGDEVLVRINSPGGELLVAEAIINEFTNLKKETGVKIIAVNDSVVASAAMYILVGIADEVLGTPRSKYLLHRALTTVTINSKGAEEIKQILEDATEPMLTAFMQKTGRTREEIEGWMDKGHKNVAMDLTTARDFGFVDGVYGGSNVINLNLARKVAYAQQKTHEEGVKVAYSQMVDELRFMEKIQKIMDIKGV